MKIRMTVGMLLMGLILGCGSRFRDTRSETLEVGELVDYSIPSSGKARSLQVTAKVAGGPIDVYVYLADDQDEAQRMITLAKPSETFLASALSKNDIDITAQIPPDKEAMVTVRAVGSEESKMDLTMSD